MILFRTYFHVILSTVNVFFSRHQSIALFRCSVPLFVANLQPQPPIPPENVVTEHDRQLQITYEHWLTSQDQILANQLKYYQIEVAKLRKTRKSLNSKQRILKKSGNELPESDNIELRKVVADQAVVQKQLESARKQSRQHGLLVQEYKSKQQSKMVNQQMVNQTQHPNTPPAHIAPQSPLMSPSPSSSSQSNMMQMSAQSPLSNPMLQPSCSPLHSPSPLMSQSPVPGANNAILQSPGNPSMSPYNSMQQSPRIGTPHSQPDENAFSPGTIV